MEMCGQETIAAGRMGDEEILERKGKPCEFGRAHRGNDARLGKAGKNGDIEGDKAAADGKDITDMFTPVALATPSH
jgi:hypothetical protein